jgi:hypothetical protein
MRMIHLFCKAGVALKTIRAFENERTRPLGVTGVLSTGIGEGRDRVSGRRRARFEKMING